MFTADGQGLPLINALFTATSAVCVTGLIVVDTAVFLSFWGQLIVLALIQSGGLSFMILSYFTLFIFNRSISVEDKFLLSYMLDSDDMNSLVKTVKRIIYITFSFELIGAFILALRFIPRYGFSGYTLFNALFHGVSAFCKAGFSLFSDSLEQFSAKKHTPHLSLNSKIVLGGATGSTAGGIKINNAAVMYGYLKSILTNNSSVVLFKQAISKTQVNKSFLVFTFSIMAVMCGTSILSISDGSDGLFNII